jgi:hypothetical protein
MTPRHTLRTLVVAAVVPVVIVLAAAALMFSWVGSVPDPVAMHWGFGGQPDGAAPPESFPVLFVIIGLSLTAILGGVVVFVAHRSVMTWMMKFISVLSPGIVVFISVTFTASLGSQRGLRSWHDAPSIFPALLIGLGAGILIAVAAWFVLPPAIKGWTSASVAPAKPLALREGERATWHHNAASPASFVWLWLVISAAVVAVTIVGIVSSGGRLWVLAILPILIMVLAIATFAWTIRVDARGLLARSTLGLPRISIPLSDIVSAEVVQVNPFQEFGGWGIRWGFNHDLGIVLRSGEGLRVNRRKGRSLVITVDDASTAASLIAGLVQRETATKR